MMITPIIPKNIVINPTIKNNATAPIANIFSKIQPKILNDIHSTATIRNSINKIVSNIIYLQSIRFISYRRAGIFREKERALVGSALYKNHAFSLFT